MEVDPELLSSLRIHIHRPGLCFLNPAEKRTLTGQHLPSQWATRLLKWGLGVILLTLRPSKGFQVPKCHMLFEAVSSTGDWHRDKQLKLEDFSTFRQLNFMLSFLSSPPKSGTFYLTSLTFFFSVIFLVPAFALINIAY